MQIPKKRKKFPFDTLLNNDKNQNVQHIYKNIKLLMSALEAHFKKFRV